MKIKWLEKSFKKSLKKTCLIETFIVYLHIYNLKEQNLIIKKKENMNLTVTTYQPKQYTQGGKPSVAGLLCQTESELTTL